VTPFRGQVVTGQGNQAE